MRIRFILLFSVLSFGLFSQNVGIGTETPHASAALDIVDTNRGLLIPRADTFAISSPAIGLLVYQFSDNGFYSFNGIKWVLLGKVSDRLEDNDKDTKIAVEQNPDEDKIRFFTNGTEVLRQNGSTLETPNSGHSVFIGEEAGLNDDLTDNNNVFVGYRAGKENSTGLNNVAIGEQALQSSTAGNNNVAIGKQSLSLNSGSNNVGIGLNALQKNTSGQKNTAVGGFAGFTNQIGDQNTLVGYEAGRGTATDVSGNVMIGHQAGKNETQSNKLYIANTDTDFPLIYGDFANNTLKIHDTLEVSDQISVGSPTGTQQESAELAGAIQIGNAATDTPSINDAGTLRWNGNASDYQGWDGEKWLSMTNPNEEIDCEIGTEIDTLPFIITEPGFYYLTKNLDLNVSGSHGVLINADDVSIDLNGYSVTGPGQTGQSDHAGFFWSDKSNITIKDGTIKNWQLAGVHTSTLASGRCFLERLVTHTNGNGIFVQNLSTLQHCESYFNDSIGFHVGSYSKIISCTSRNNGTQGFLADDFVIIKDCLSIFNTQQGFSFGSNCNVASCFSRGNSSDGFRCSGNNSINDCIAYINASDGFKFANSCILNNCISNGNNNGFQFSSLSEIKKCIAVNNSKNGFTFGSTSNLESCTAQFNQMGFDCDSENNFTDCKSISNSQIGFNYKNNCVLISCLATGNFQEGFKSENNSVLNTCVSRSNLRDGFIGIDGNQYINCKAILNSKNGFIILDKNILELCQSNNNTDTGITCEDYNTIQNCGVIENNKSGIDARHFNEIESNLISFNNTSESTSDSGLDINIGNKVVGNSISDNYHIGISINSNRNLLDGNDVVNTRTAGAVTGIGFVFLSVNNAWRNNTAVGNTGSNVSATKPPTSRSFNNWMY